MVLRPAGSCTRPYVPMAMATAAPAASGRIALAADGREPTVGVEVMSDIAGPPLAWRTIISRMRARSVDHGPGPAWRLPAARSPMPDIGEARGDILIGPHPKPGPLRK